MTPETKILTYDFHGEPALLRRENLARLCTNFEITSIMKSIKEGDDYSSLVDLIEDGSDGFLQFTDAKLSKHWNDIREHYVNMLENDELIFEEDIRFEVISGEAKKAEAVRQIEQMHDLQRYEPRTLPVTLKDWQPEEDIEENAPAKLEAFIEISSDRISFNEGRGGEGSRSVAIEMQDGNLRVLSFARDEEAPMKTTIPREGLITNDDHDYLIETSSVAGTEGVLKGPGQ